MLWNIFYDYALPGVLSVLCALAVVIIPALVKPLFKWLGDRGVIVEESRQRMFQNTVERGVLEVIRKAGGGQITEHLIQHGVRHVQKGAPDQVKHFDLDAPEIERHLRNALTAKEITTGIPVAKVPVPTPRPATASGSSQGAAR